MYWINHDFVVTQLLGYLREATEFSVFLCILKCVNDNVYNLKRKCIFKKAK